MGSNQSKKTSNLSTYEYSNGRTDTDATQRLKRRKSNSNMNLNRSPASPMLRSREQPNFEGFRNLENGLNNQHINDAYNPHSIQNSSNQTSSKSSFSTNTHSTPSPPAPLRQTFQTEPKRLQAVPRAATHNNSNYERQVNGQPVKGRNENIFDLNKKMRSNQQKLSKIIKQSDSNQPSYHMNSKLYKPNSLIAANHNQLLSPSKLNNSH